jgi:sugar diacid utilization regulator
MENTARAQRMVDAIGDVLEKKPVRLIAGVRDNLVIVVISGMRRQSGWTRPRVAIAKRVYPQLRLIGPAALIGLSNDVPSTSHIPRAAAEAKFALEFADVGNRVVHYSSIPFRELLVTQVRDSIQSALPEWLDEFVAADTKAKVKLTATLKAYADTNMNVLQAAEVLAVHPNTIYARVQRINNVTGLDPLTYRGLTELLLAMDCAE